jgi:hypothetical protein
MDRGNTGDLAGAGGRRGAEILSCLAAVDLYGHSLGSIGVSVETEYGLEIMTGDALPFVSVARSVQNLLVLWNAEQAEQSIHRVLRAWM